MKKLLYAGLASLTMAAACGGVDSGNVDKTPTSSFVDTHGAPRVERPLKYGRYLQDPCALITPAQRADLARVYKLGQKPRKLPNPNSLATCTFSGSDTPPFAAGGGLQFIKGKGGLGTQYNQREDFKIFEPLTVAGYPAVNNVGLAEQSAGVPTCVINIGITDSQVLIASFDGEENKTRPFMCKAATTIATAAVETLKANQS